MNKTELIAELKERIESAREDVKENKSSYATGYDSGCLTTLKEILELVEGEND